MQAREARRLCPDLVVVQVPVRHGKADLTIYRDAGAAVLEVLASQSVAERASIDEASVRVCVLFRCCVCGHTSCSAAAPGAAPLAATAPQSSLH